MISSALRWSKAIPALMLGIAFFLPSCVPKVPVEKEPVKAAPLIDHFAQAEAYWERGELDRALSAYSAYVEQYPEDEKSALALHRMGEIYFKTEYYKKALDLFKTIREKHADYERLPTVEYQIADTLYLLGEHQSSKDAALKWLDEYPLHSTKEDILLLLGKNFEALGDNPQAFNWWLEAKGASLGDIQKQAELDQRLEDLIEISDIEELEQIAKYADGTDYAPKVYQRMASIFLEANELEKARNAAMALVRSTPEQSWVSQGREILEKIQEELSVKRDVVGCLLPLSGPFAIYGEEVLNGIQLGIGMSSEPGQGPDLELIIKDTGGNPEYALAGLEDLVKNEKVMAIIGPLSSKTAMAAAIRAQALGAPVITLTQKEGITEKGEMVFRNFLTPSQEVKRLLDTAIGKMDIKRFGILYPENSYGKFFMNLFWDRLEEMGATVTAAESYDPNETDFAAQIKKMIGLYYTRPDSLVQELREMWTPEQEESEIYPEEPQPIIDFDAVFIPDNFQRVAMLAPQLVYHDVLDVLLMGTSLWQSPKLIEMAGDYVQGAIFSSGFFERLADSRVDAFTEEYRTNFDAAPGILAATGYDTIRLLKKVLEEDYIRTRRDFQKALLEYRNFQGVTGTIFFDHRGEVQKEPLLLTISGKHMALFQEVYK